MVSRDEKARKKAIGKNAKRLAKFSSVDEAEAAAVHEQTKGMLNEKRQNYVQALFDYARNRLNLAKDVAKLERFEGVVESIEKGKNNQFPKDELGLIISPKELRIQVQIGHAEVRLSAARTEKMLQDIKKTWNMDEDQIEKQVNAWILGEQKIY